MPIKSPRLSKVRDRFIVGLFVFLLTLALGGGAGVMMFNGFTACPSPAPSRCNSKRRPASASR
ncbi:MAG: hypothetical protein B7X67_13775 [Rhizobiales bacterium 39-66-18]|nr:MAG: hypothetical protein B7X67_13775 [Rhizobiales bacterium 39-66-18]